MIETKVAPGIWSQIVSAVGSFMTEIHLDFKMDGLYVSQITTDRSMMVGVRVPASEFGTYDCTKERLVILNLDQLTKIVKRVAGTIEIVMSNDEDGPDSNVFNVVLVGEDNRRSFTLPMLTPDEGKSVQLPNTVEFESDLVMLGSCFKDIAKDLDIISANPRFFVDSKRLLVKSQGDGADTKLVYELGKDLISIDKRIDENEPLSSMFRLDALKDMAEAFDSKTQVTIKLSNGKPLWVEVPLGESGLLIMILAPVVDRREKVGE